MTNPKDLKGKGKATDTIENVIKTEEILTPIAEIKDDSDILAEVAKIDAIHDSKDGESSNTSSQEISVLSPTQLTSLKKELTTSLEKDIKENSVVDKHFTFEKRKEYATPLDVLFRRKTEVIDVKSDYDGKFRLLKSVHLYKDRWDYSIDKEELSRLVNDVEKETTGKNLTIFNNYSGRKDNAFLSVFKDKMEDSQKKIKVLESRLKVVKSERDLLQKNLDENKENEEYFFNRQNKIFEENKNLNSLEARNNVLMTEWNIVARELSIANSAVKSLTRKLIVEESSVNYWKEQYEETFEKMQAEGRVNAKQRDLLLQGKAELKRLNTKIENLERDKARMQTSYDEKEALEKEIAILKKKVNGLEWKLIFANSKLNFCLGINTVGRQTIGRLPVIGKYAMNGADVLQSIILGTRTVSSNDSYLESIIWVAMFQCLIVILYFLIPMAKFIFKSKVASALNIFSNYKDAVQPPASESFNKDIINIEVNNLSIKSKKNLKNKANK